MIDCSAWLMVRNNFAKEIGESCSPRTEVRKRTGGGRLIWRNDKRGKKPIVTGTVN